MRHRNPCTDATPLRDFGGLTEVSRHEPHTAPFAHRHFAAYVAIVLSGEYTEASAEGIMQLAQGDVVVHPAFHHHANVFAASPVAVLNLVLPMPVGLNTQYARLRLADLRLSQEDILHRPGDSVAAISGELERLRPVARPPGGDDVIEFAARQLKEAQAPKVYHVAAEAGVSAEHLVRKFRARYGMSPGRYRAEHRFHHAVRRLFAGENAADAACSSGYSDQSHMTRDFQRRTGTTPIQLSHQLRSAELA